SLAFFFQAEDGIRDFHVTGVQTCALPISRIVAKEPRIDGRDNKTVRPISIEVGVLPKAHGSALFTRGETQALVVATLGNARDVQIGRASCRERGWGQACGGPGRRQVVASA